MYTSGTTGDPKGVMMSHGNVYAAVFGLRRRLDQVLGEPDVNAPVEEQDTHLAYLPLAHILEFCAENILLIRGATLGYGTPRTLTDTSAKPHGDLKEFKPTFFVGVPRIFDTIKKAVEGKLPAPGEFRRRVFDRAYAERKEALSKGYDTPYWNGRVFSGPAALLGGRCKMIISGGAPMSSATYEFLTVVFGCAVGQGYGLTETCAAGTIQRYYDLQKENVGGLLSVCEVKLRDVDPWKHTDQPHPRGEVLIRGPTITQGYYNQPEKTKEAFLDDGWFATGDVGMFAADGTLKIVGRTKALAKNSHGEYIAMESLESLYVQNDLVLPNGVCVLVDSQEGFICALVLTDEAKAMKFAAANKISGTFPAILDTKEFRKAAAASLAATAKAAGKKPFELVKNVAVLNEEWTPENGILTAASKLRRSEVDKKYKDLIEKLFKEQ
jgi:long-chain acyl-CoA synthetase